VPTDNLRQNLLSGAIVAALLVLGWFIYEPALDGVFLFDDRPNLYRLETVTDPESALVFTLSGTAGPLGRPLALASFLPQAEAWNLGTAGPFLVVNVLIHLLNGLLVYYLFLALARLRGAGAPDDRWVAIVGMALWLFMPLLASSSLMIVQRMTTLSATFVLLGLNGYLAARSGIDTRPRRALLLMSAALVLATSFAVLTKENGALLPILVLVLEATLLSRPAAVPPGRWRAWHAVFLVVPTALAAVFLLSKLGYSDALILRRGYSGFERLLTESRVLWDYLANAFVPRPAEYSPFHDNHEVRRSILEPSTALAVAGWITTLALAIVYRRAYPVAAFAALWFLAGHMLESTTIPLYLYFEHRNYVPILGPVFALACTLLGGARRHAVLARVMLPAYVMVSAGVLYSVTTLWGNPMMAAGYWYANAPGSVAAAGHLAGRQAVAMAPQVGAVTLREFADAYPQDGYARIAALTFSCRGSPGADHSADVAVLIRTLPEVRFTYSTASMLDALMFTASQTGCNVSDGDTGRRLAAAIMENPSYSADPKHTSFHHQLLARFAFDSGDPARGMEHLELARQALPTAQLHTQFVATLGAARRFDEAHEYLDSAARALPVHPLRRLAARAHLRQLRDMLAQMEAQYQRSDHPAAVVEARKE